MSARLSIAAIIAPEATPASSQSNSLREAVSVSERVKQVAKLAAEIDMAAINASLAARQVRGNNRSGFAVVARELRKLSGKLQVFSNEIVDAVFAVVNCSARSLRQQRNCEIHNQVQGKGVPERQQKVCDDCWQRIEQLRAEAETHWTILEGTVHQTQEACKMGTYLAHCARVEATQGGAIAMKLQQVANDIDKSFVEITHRMKQISAARRT